MFNATAVGSIFSVSLILLIVFYSNEYCEAYKLLSESPSNCPVYLTLSPLGENLADSKLQINWGPCRQSPEWINFYENINPIITNNPIPIQQYQIFNKTSGHIDTNSKLGKFQLPAGWKRADFLSEQLNNDLNGSIITSLPSWDGTKCMSFYVTSLVNGKLQSMDCFKIQPNWMAQQLNLWSIPIRNIFLPGTHCSACSGHRIYHRNDILLKKFGYTQNLDVWTQLVMGIRFLDISVGCRKYHQPISSDSSSSTPQSTNKSEIYQFWVVNDSLFITPLIRILKDIRNFVRFTGEMVIVDFSDFPFGFYNRPNRHNDLIALLETELGDVAFRRNDQNENNTTNEAFNLTMNQLKNRRKMLIITYSKPNVVHENNLLWPSWSKFSTINLKKNEIYDYMRKAFTRNQKSNDNNNNNSISSEIGWNFVGIQGVESSYSTTNNLPSSRERANAINQNITMWISGPWSLTANIVALDYVFNTNLIDIAIYTNSHKRSDTNNLITIDLNE